MAKDKEVPSKGKKILIPAGAHKIKPTRQAAPTPQRKNVAKNSAAANDPETLDEFNLSPMQSRFVHHYIISLNAKKAAAEAGYSQNTTYNKLMRDPKIIYAIHTIQGRRCERFAVTADAVIQELAAIAFTNIIDVVSWNSGGIKLKDSNQLKRTTAAAIQEVSETITGKSTTTKVKMHDKLGALKDLMKHLGLYEKEDEDVKKVDPLEVLREAIELSQQRLKDINEEGKKKKPKYEPEPDEDDEDEDED